MRQAAFLAFLIAVAPVAALGETGRNLLMARVAVGDLDLRTEKGAATMMRRLNSAAEELCILPQSAVFPGNPGREFRCRKEAVAAAVQRLRTPQLEVAYLNWLSAIRP